MSLEPWERRASERFSAVGLVVLCLLTCPTLAVGSPQAASEAAALARATATSFPGTPSLVVQASRLARDTALTKAQSSPPQPQTKSWIGRHPKLFWALVGFGVGCVVGASQVGGSQDNFYNALDEFACPVVGGIGAGTGAIIGWVVSRAR